MAHHTLAHYLKPDVIRTISRLDLSAKCIVDGFFSGLHRSPFHGFSTTFSEHREYAPGDDLKFIDWNVYRKTERFYVKKYEAQTNLECTLLVDMSRSMAFRYNCESVSKLEYVIYLAAAISYLLLKQSDAVGVLTFDRDVRAYIRPRSRPTQLAAIIRLLSQADAALTTRIGTALTKAAALLRHRGLVIVCSDFLDDTDAALKGLQRIAYHGHDTIVFHVLDYAEIEFPFERYSRFVDSENSRHHVTAIGDDVRHAYCHTVKTFIDTMRTRCESLGLRYVPLNTAQQFDVALAALMQRARR